MRQEAKSSILLSIELYILLFFAILFVLLCAGDASAQYKPVTNGPPPPEPTVLVTMYTSLTGPAIDTDMTVYVTGNEPYVVAIPDRSNIVVRAYIRQSIFNTGYWSITLRANQSKAPLTSVHTPIKVVQDRRRVVGH